MKIKSLLLFTYILLFLPLGVYAQTTSEKSETPCEKWYRQLSEQVDPLAGGQGPLTEQQQADKTAAQGTLQGRVCTDLIEGIPNDTLGGDTKCAEEEGGLGKKDAAGKPIRGTENICYAVISGSGLGGISGYVSMIYRYASWAIVTLAVLMLIVSGIQMSLGGAIPDKVAEARKRIFQIIGGLVLFFMIGVILRTINPTFFT